MRKGKYVFVAFAVLAATALFALAGADANKPADEKKPPELKPADLKADLSKENAGRKQTLILRFSHTTADGDTEYFIATLSLGRPGKFDDSALFVYYVDPTKRDYSSNFSLTDGAKLFEQVAGMGFDKWKDSDSDTEPEKWHVFIGDDTRTREATFAGSLASTPSEFADLLQFIDKDFVPVLPAPSGNILPSPGGQGGGGGGGKGGGGGGKGGGGQGGEGGSGRGGGGGRSR
jgi:hypothetical protein